MGKLFTVTVPVKFGDAVGAFKSSAAWVSVDIGLLKSGVLLQLLKSILATLFTPTIDLVIPDTVPVNVGDVNDAFESAYILVTKCVSNVGVSVDVGKLVLYAFVPVHVFDPDNIPVPV